VTVGGISVVGNVLDRAAPKTGVTQSTSSPRITLNNTTRTFIAVEA
jgi:hypothetical protein